MWKYQCKNQLISLGSAFALGVLLMILTLGNSNYVELMEGMVPTDILAFLQSNPYLIYLSGGMAIMGLCNVFLIGNILSAQFGISSFLIFLVLLLVPEYAIMIGIYTAPIMLGVALYGYISLKLQDRKLMRAHHIQNGDELVRMYTIHHPLNVDVEDLGVETRKQIRKITWIYALGLLAVFCVMFFVNNILIIVVALFGFMLAFQALARYRQQVFAPIANLLYTHLNPEACMSALIYYCKRGNHYHLTNQALMANCLIYMDDPSLAQDVLITYPRGNANSVLTYWSLMAYTYYLLKDEAGLYRCKEEISKVKAPFGSVGLMYKTTEQNAIENKIRLMNRDFNTCKQYYLNVLRSGLTNLQKADAEYYIALISFVQEDYTVARMYFEKVVEHGGKLYFVKKAANYLEKINAMHLGEEYAEDPVNLLPPLDPMPQEN